MPPPRVRGTRLIAHEDKVTKVTTFINNVCKDERMLSMLEQISKDFKYSFFLLDSKTNNFADAARTRC